jgi:cytidylate kinase
LIRIITIEREFGCGAAEIAEMLAQQLGWKLWDKDLTAEIAKMANCRRSAVEEREERLDSLYYRLTRSFWRGSHEGSIAVDPLQMLDADSIVRFSEKIVDRAATEGNCVMVGRGSQHFLQDRKDTLRFFFYAAREDKIARLIREGTARKDAAHLIDTVDRERAAFIKTFFHDEWPDRKVYHAMINTASGDAAVVRAVLSFLQTEPAKQAA